MTVAQIVNHGERFNGCVSEWEWVSVNITRIGLVGRRREKLVGHSKLHLFVCLLHHYYSYLFFFQFDGSYFMEEDYHLRWKRK